MAFAQNDSSQDDISDSDSDVITEVVASVTLHLKLAESEYNEDRKTLFATHIWHGSRALANYMASSFSVERLNGSSVLELGAGAGIPSLICHHHDAAFVCASDYPVHSLISVLEENIDCNRCLSASGQIKAIGYKWWVIFYRKEREYDAVVCWCCRGDDIGPILAVNGGRNYDIVLASECLWRHEQHEILASSIASALRPGGCAVLAYSHHIPGLEDQDDNFLETARAHHFEVVKRESLRLPHMWSSSKEVDMYICEIVYRPPHSSCNL